MAFIQSREVSARTPRPSRPATNGSTMSEQMRLAMLCHRDGEDAAKEWARSTVRLYRQSMENPAHFASQADWKIRFELSVQELATFMEGGTFDVP
jgi:hypothetical protein